MNNPVSFTLLCTILLALAGVSPLSAQNLYPVSSIPANLLPNAKSVVREDLTRLNVKSIHNSVLTRRQVISYLKRPEDGELDMALGENGFIKVRSMQFTLYDATGRKVSDGTQSDAQEYGSQESYEFSDTRFKVLSVPVLDPPFTVAYSYEIAAEDFYLFPDWTIQEIGQAVEQRDLQITCPAKYKFNWHGVRTDLQPRFDATENTWRWSASMLPAIPSEKATPCFDRQYAYLAFAPEIFAYGNREGSQKDWSSFGKFVYELNRQTNEVSSETEKKVRELTTNCATEQEKITALYRYLQENTRYVSVQVGMGGWRSFEASYVDKKRYGDCKALSNYMRTLLELAGIPAWLALVHGDDEGAPEVFPDLADPSAFNHVILYIPSSNMWLECTSTDLPAGYLGTFTSNRTALVLTPAGGKLMPTTRLTEKDNLDDNTFDVQLREDGMAQIRHSGVRKGAMQESYRTMSIRKSKEDFTRYFSEEVGFPIVKVERLECKPDRQQAALTLDYQLEAPNFGVKSGKRMFINWSKYVAAGRTLPIDTTRVMPVAYPLGESHFDSLHIALPAGFKVENVPPEAKIESPYGYYERKIFTDASGAVVIVRRLVYVPFEAPPEHYGKVRQFYTDILQADGKQIVLVKKE
ncbi:MAG TPA: DUF3857 domain-containing protein [Saprospiraceae bacterium]|nr:DUF3857 domain-containing protein [Saprospiraceae bacterium]